jgi:hypothetical protein
MTKRIGASATARLAPVSLIGVIGCGLALPGALAQEPGRVTVEVGDCVNLPSPEDRFACYERQVEAARSAPTPAPAEPASTATPRTEPPSETAAAPADEKAESLELIATVTGVRETVPNSLVITLDNGQVWRQTFAKFYPVQPGQQVRIRPSRWGGTYWLTVDALRSYIQVERVQ